MQLRARLVISMFDVQRSMFDVLPAIVTPIRGHHFSTSQFAQSGLRAAQRRRPCQMSQWLHSVQFSSTA